MGNEYVTYYVLGFAIQDEAVLLIRKLRPQWQAGFLNGIGGKQEQGESSLDAMIREFKEECGIESKIHDWTPFATMGGDDWLVTCYKSGTIDIFNAKTMGDERIEIVDLDKIKDAKPIANLSWLIPLALCHTSPYFANINYK